jgi:geranylgeranyl diphosphate synthase type II
MDIGALLEGELDAAIARSASDTCPPRLADALRYAVFPGGARIRPRLTLAVANACGNDSPRAAVASAAAIELLHCASLVHDDLPCFDNSALRRGKPSVHMAYGERLAVLAGDALIVLAFEWLAVRAGDRLAPLTRIIAACVGGPSGICAGQAWECEQSIDIVRYQRAKTGALFAACTMAGAAASGYEPMGWQKLGFAIGEAFQVADDLRDVAGSAEALGKPVHQDEANQRPNFVAELGFDGAMGHFEDLLAEAMAAIPACPGAEQLGKQITGVSRSLVSGLSARTVAA